MALPTLLICEAGEEKTKQIEELIRSYPELRLVGTTNRQNAAKQVGGLYPKLVWVELAPEPMKALTLLGDLREQHPKTQFLVSNETLDGGLIKTSMQLGAIDFLDPQSWKDQMPDVVKRVVIKAEQAHAAPAAAAAPAAPPPVEAAAASPVAATKEVAASKEMTAAQKRTSTRSKAVEGSPTASPPWVWAVIFGLFGLSFVFYKLYP